ncbi:hypothetical protein [Gordonia desulfuricans]|uniref:hypothetical protein n=1 Tax=Gordonia desulfuricans TaxID=89051 RepID=UPI000ACCD0DF|nr:hypothetical protein [Gordonia desulfuricans]
MNPSVALIITAMCGLAACWSLAGVVPRWGRWPERVTLVIVVAVLAWIAGGFVTWLTGHGGLARPGVFAGYAATAAGLAALGIPAAGGLRPRGAAVVRALVLALLAFACWRAESVWMSELLMAVR